MPLKGLSIYLGLEDYTLSDNINYLQKAKQLGFDFIFTSFHMPEQTKVVEDLNKIVELASSIQMPIVVDVSKPAFEKVKLPKNIILRLDYGFSKMDIVAFSNNYSLIELNASTITKAYLDELKALGCNFSHLRLSHNFYPKPYTGLDIYDVKAKNAMYHEYGLTVLGYLPSNSGKRPPLYQGLPTVESHRNQDLTISAAELIASGCDGVCVGDAFMSEADLLKYQALDLDYPKILVKPLVKLSETDIANLSLKNRFRIDEGRYLKRGCNKQKVVVEPNNTIDLEPFMVTIDNVNLKRYMGEVNIVKQSFSNDGSKNVVGIVQEQYQTLVSLLDAGSKYYLEITKE